jgi:hypothetical protein
MRRVVYVVSSPAPLTDGKQSAVKQLKKLVVTWQCFQARARVVVGMQIRSIGGRWLTLFLCSSARHSHSSSQPWCISALQSQVANFVLWFRLQVSGADACWTCWYYSMYDCERQDHVYRIKKRST